MKKLGFFRKKKTSVTESLAGEYLDPQIDLDNRPLPPIPSDSGGALKVEAKVLCYTHYKHTRMHMHAQVCTCLRQPVLCSTLQLVIVIFSCQT